MANRWLAITTPHALGFLCFSACNDETNGIMSFTDAQLSAIQVNDEPHSDNPLHICKWIPRMCVHLCWKKKKDGEKQSSGA